MKVGYVAGSGRTTYRGRRAFHATALAALLALALSACGSSGETGEGGATGEGADLAAAANIVENATAEVTFESPGPPIDASKAKGKTVFYLVHNSSNPFGQQIKAGNDAAFAAAGVTKIEGDGQADISTAARLISGAVKRGVDLIMIQSFPFEALAAPLKEAKAAGIPVVGLLQGDPGLPTAQEKELGVVAKASYSHYAVGTIMAAFAIHSTKGNTNAAVVTTSDAPQSAPLLKGMRKTFADHCPSCKFDVHDVPAAQWQAQLPTLTRTLINQNQDLNMLLPIFDPMTTLMVPSVVAANAADDVPIVTFNATGGPMAELANGNVITGDIGSPQEWLGWAGADQALRVLTEQPPLEDEKLPLRLFTRDNVKGLDLKGSTLDWFGDIDLAGQYKALWGLS